MKFIYPAVFRPTEDKKYNAFFPDLACCEANGDTLDDAIENANAAAYDWIYTELMEFEGKLCKYPLPGWLGRINSRITKTKATFNIIFNKCPCRKCLLCKKHPDR